MTIIARGTTPTIIFKFSQVEVENISTAYLVIKQFHKNYLEKDISTAAISEEEENALEWTLTQEDTFKLKEHSPAIILCDFVLQDGTRGQTKALECVIAPPGKKEVL